MLGKKAFAILALVSTCVRARIIVSILVMLLFVSLSLTTPAKASVLWSDNFDDGNLNGWTISGSSFFNYGYSTLSEGNLSAADGTLRATGAPWGVEDYNFASHPAMTTTGTWSWDLYFNPGGTIAGYMCHVYFINEPALKPPLDWNGYGFDISNRGDVHSFSFENGLGADLNMHESFFDPHPGSWTHFDVTHDSNGRWCIYVNGTLNLDIVDKKYSDFSYFWFSLQPGPAIDNVVISDTIFVPQSSLKVTVKDSGGNVLSGAAVSSTVQPGGQTAVSGVTGADGSVTFTGLAVGNYTLKVSKDGYVSGSAQGAVASGAKTELSSTLQAQPSSGIPGFPISSVIIGVLLSTALLWLYERKARLQAV